MFSLDYDYLYPLVDAGLPPYYDILPFHAYPETWEDSTVETYLDEQYYDYFVPENVMSGNKPVWVNEMGFATTKGKTEEEQPTGSCAPPARFSPAGIFRSLDFTRSRT